MPPLRRRRFQEAFAADAIRFDAAARCRHMLSSLSFFASFTFSSFFFAFITLRHTPPFTAATPMLSHFRLRHICYADFRLTPLPPPLPFFAAAAAC